MYCTQIINVKKKVLDICRVFNEYTNLDLHIISQSISYRSTSPVTKTTACYHCEVGVFKRGVVISPQSYGVVLYV